MKLVLSPHQPKNNSRSNKTWHVTSHRLKWGGEYMSQNDVWCASKISKKVSRIIRMVPKSCDPVLFSNYSMMFFHLYYFLYCHSFQSYFSTFCCLLYHSYHLFIHDLFKDFPELWLHGIKDRITGIEKIGRFKQCFSTYVPKLVLCEAL